jgi:hypothetical protein
MTPNDDQEENPKTKLTIEEHYKIYRAYLEHEDDLLNHRSTWHITAQGFFFTALGVLLQWKPDKNSVDDLQFLRGFVLWLLPFLGMTVAVAAFSSITAAHAALNRLSDDWDLTIRPSYDLPDLILPQLAGAGERYARRYGKFPAITIPIVILLAWALILAALICSAWHRHFDAPTAFMPVNQSTISSPALPKAHSKSDLLKNYADADATVRDIEAQLLREYGVAVIPVPEPITPQKLHHSVPKPCKAKD